MSTETEKKYSRIFSSLFCSIAILTLTSLCLLNNFSVDLYTTSIILKIVTPAAVCFWILGYIIGTILDKKAGTIIKNKVNNEKKAYEIPSMFCSDNSGTDIETEGI